MLFNKKPKKSEEERIKELVRLEAKNYLEKYIADVNDLKTDYLKRYLGEKCNTLSIHVSKLVDKIDNLSQRTRDVEKLVANDDLIKEIRERAKQLLLFVTREKF